MKNAVGPPTRPSIISQAEAQKYRGRWVAVQQGHVIAHADSERELFQLKHVDPHTMAMHLPAGPRV